MELNLNNLESLVFHDKKLRKLLPELAHYFSQWDLGMRVSSLRNISKQAILDFSQSLSDSHLKRMAGYFGEPVTIFKLDHRIVKSYKFSLQEAEKRLNELQMVGNITTYRDGEHLYILFWN